MGGCMYVCVCFMAFMLIAGPNAGRHTHTHTLPSPSTDRRRADALRAAVRLRRPTKGFMCLAQQQQLQQLQQNRNSCKNHTPHTHTQRASAAHVWGVVFGFA